MKKNLRNILVLAMGLMTTVSFAQDWNVDSRTRIDMSGDNDEMSTDQRATLSTTWGGSDWGIHISSDVNYTLGGDAASMGIYEAYASAQVDLGMTASVTAGRQAINNGSGALMSSNDWGANRTTWDGMAFGFEMRGINATLGYHNQNTGEDATGSNMWLNANGDFSGWNVNLLYMTEEGSDDAATGIDIKGDVMGAGISASMNTDFSGNDMRVIGLSYAVNDDMGINVSQTVYSEDADFNMAGTNMDGSWLTTGGMGYLGAGSENLAYGLTYNMGGISMGATMHNVTNSTDETVDRSAMEVSLGYSLGDNAALNVSYVTDEDGTNDDTYTWITLTVTP